jgi:hypothetical protein
MAQSLLDYINFVRRMAFPRVTITDLNADTLQRILRELNSGSPKQLLALSSVSKRFRETIRSPMVWHTLDLRESASTLTDKDVYGIVRDDEAFTCLEVLNLSGCSRLTDVSVLKLLHKCFKTVREINLSECELITVETAKFIWTHCKAVQKLNLTNCKRVPTAELITSLKYPPVDGTLRELHISGTKHLTGRISELDFGDILSAFNHFKRGQIFDNTAPVFGDVEDSIELIRTCWHHLQDWYHGRAITLCDHADMVMQQVQQPSDDGNVGQYPPVTLFPECGHAMCVDCQATERRNMTFENGHYVYPCPGCAQRTPKRYMPNPGGFEVQVASSKTWLATTHLHRMLFHMPSELRFAQDEELVDEFVDSARSLPA